MDFSLSSSLVGSAVSNPDKLALDLQFATDKTLTARKGPTPAFTRGSSGTFVGSNGLIQSAGNNVARFDHDPVTLACKGLLIEESRTNNATQSGAMNLWGGAGGSTRSVSTTLSPDGIGFATRASSGGLSFGGIVARSLSTLTSVVGTQYTASCFVKKENYRYVSIDYGPIRPGGTALPFFDLDTLVFNANGSATTATIVSYPNGWYRLSVSGAAVTANSSTLDVNLVASNGQGGGTIGAGNNILVWGAQLETGSFPTSYIPTTTASVIRSADVCSISGSDFSGMYNQPEGTLFADVTPQTVAQLSVVVGVNTTSFQNSHLIYKINSTASALGNRWVGASTFGASGETLITTSTDVAVSRSKLAYGYKLNDFAFAYAGTIIGIDTNSRVASPNTMRIGSRDDGLVINGHLASVRYYKKRLPNAKLASLTV